MNTGIMKPKVLFTFPYGRENMKKVEDLGYKLVIEKEKFLSESFQGKDIDVLVCFNPFSRINLSRFPNLKWIQLISKGIDQVPAKKIKEQKITVTNNGYATAVPISEWIIMMLMSLFKNTQDIFRRKNEKSWKEDRAILELYGKTIGFLGTGNIASETAARLKAFQVELIGLNSDGRDIPFFSNCYPSVELKHFLSKCDAVISTLPDVESTRNLLNKDSFAAMKKGSCLINISRGNIINETDLLIKLKEGHFRGVALDVFNEEPLPEDNPLWAFDNVMITPHNSFYSDLYTDRVFQVIYGNLKHFINGEPLEHIVDLSRGY